MPTRLCARAGSLVRRLQVFWGSSESVDRSPASWSAGQMLAFVTCCLRGSDLFFFPQIYHVTTAWATCRYVPLLSLPGSKHCLCADLFYNTAAGRSGA